MSCIFKRLILFRETKRMLLLTHSGKGTMLWEWVHLLRADAGKMWGLSEQLNTTIASSQIFHWLSSKNMKYVQTFSLTKKCPLQEINLAGCRKQRTIATFWRRRIDRRCWGASCCAELESSYTPDTSWVWGWPRCTSHPGGTTHPSSSAVTRAACCRRSSLCTWQK